MNKNQLIITLVIISILLLNSCTIYPTVDSLTSSQDVQSISKEGFKTDRQLTITGNYNLTNLYIQNRIEIETRESKHSITIRYIYAIGLIIFLFFSSYLTYKYKVKKLKH